MGITESREIKYKLRADPRFIDVYSAFNEFLLGKEIEMNCRTFALFLTWARGYEVPPNYGSFQWFEDPGKISTPMHLIDNIQDGDILGFSRLNEANMINLHIGVARRNANGEIEVLHASRLAGKVIVTPLHEMGLDPRHKKLYIIRRPTKNDLQVNEEALKALGWYNS